MKLGLFTFVCLKGKATESEQVQLHPLIHGFPNAYNSRDCASRVQELNLRCPMGVEGTQPHKLASQGMNLQGVEIRKWTRTWSSNMGLRHPPVGILLASQMAPLSSGLYLPALVSSAGQQNQLNRGLASFIFSRKTLCLFFFTSDFQLLLRKASHTERQETKIVKTKRKC